jgi:hypothetical protein
MMLPVKTITENYTVKSNFLFRHGPFAFPGKGGGGGGMICIDSPSGNNQCFSIITSCVSSALLLGPAKFAELYT